MFCWIVAREEPAQIVYETDAVLAFRDIAPVAPVHVQLIPREHIASAAEVREHHAGMLAELFLAAQRVAREEGLAERGWRLVTNVGREGGQHIEHLHLHLLGGRPMGWPPG